MDQAPSDATVTGLLADVRDNTISGLVLKQAGISPTAVGRNALSVLLSVVFMLIVAAFMILLVLWLTRLLDYLRRSRLWPAWLLVSEEDAEYLAHQMRHQMPRSRARAVLVSLGLSVLTFAQSFTASLLSIEADRADGQSQLALGLGGGGVYNASADEEGLAGDGDGQGVKTVGFLRAALLWNLISIVLVVSTYHPRLAPHFYGLATGCACLACLFFYIGAVFDEASFHLVFPGRNNYVQAIVFTLAARCFLEMFVLGCLAIFYIGLPFGYSLVLLVEIIVGGLLWSQPYLNFYAVVITVALALAARSLDRSRRETFRQLSLVQRRNAELKSANRELLSSSERLTSQNDILRTANTDLRRDLGTDGGGGGGGGGGGAAPPRWGAASLYTDADASLLANAFDQRSELLTSWRIPAERLAILDAVAHTNHADVFRATLEGVGEVCVKRLTNLRLGEHTADQLRNEILLLAQLRHPNVVQFLGASLELPHFGFVTEWMAGGSLWHLLHQSDHALARPNRPAGWENLKLRMATDAARGMTYLHAWRPNALVHRDLKTLNLLVDERQRVKVADFGQSRWRPSNANLMSHGTVGTPSYLAPEIVLGLPYGEAVDVFSFGILLWEIFTERLPYYGLHPPTILFQLIAKRLRPPMHDADLEKDVGSFGRSSTRGPPVPPIPRHVDELMRRCWAHTPEDRPPFPEVLEALQPQASRGQPSTGFGV